MPCLKNIFWAIFSCCGFLANAQSPGNTGKLTLRGNLGTSANFYSSNELVDTRPSYAWNIYGNFTAQIKEVSLPFSFVVNQYSRSNNPAFIQAGLSPTYKWAKLHVGDRYIQFSPLVFEGQNFRGVGLELNPRQLRFGVFYGRLNKAVDEDTSVNNFRVPQYSRTGYGAKIGYGNSGRFIDLLYFHARDDSSSSSFVNSSAKKPLAAHENAVLGLSARTTIINKIILLADVAVSGLTQDLSLGTGKTDSLTPKLTKFFGNFLTYNSSTEADYAGQFSFLYNSPGFNTNLGYRRVEPGFRSLGTPYMFNDIELISWINYLSLAAGKVNINTSLVSQHNNLDKNLETELQTLTSAISLNAIIKTNYQLNFSYSGYNFKNKDGTIILHDDTRLNQNISQFNFSPGYSLAMKNYIHSVSANINVSVLNDKNATTSRHVDSDNFSSSLNYIFSIIDKACSFSVNGSYARYKQDTTSYNSFGGIIGGSVQLLKQQTLNIRGNLGYFFNRLNSGTSQRNITYAIHADYMLKSHSFSVFANYIYTPPNKINELITGKVPYAVATKNIAGGLTYNYNF